MEGRRQNQLKYNNQQGREAATEDSGGWEDNDDDGGNNNCLTRKNQIDGGRCSPCALWGINAAAAALYCRGNDFVVVNKQYGAVREHSDAHTIECHQRTSK